MKSMAPRGKNQHCKKQSKLRGIYAITDESLVPEARFEETIRAALAGGIKVLQYRDKSNHPRKRFAQASAIQRCCQAFDALLIINDDVELAREVNAAGVHLGRSDPDYFSARALLGENAVIGISCYDSLERARTAQAQGADYVAFGSFFPSQTKPGAVPAPISILATARSQLSIPIAAIGGITSANGEDLVRAGADMLAIISAIFSTSDVHQASTRLVQMYNAISHN